MSEWWDEAFAVVSDVVPVPLLVLGSLLFTILIALGWYYWPAWLPSHWRRRAGAPRGSSTPGRRWRLGPLRWRLRWRRRRRSAVAATDLDELAPDELPDLPAAVLAVTADELAAAGRYAEAVRERLRAIVRDLIERGLVPPSPGWTVTELARGAATAVPALAPPLGAAVDVFSRIWYGLRPATADDDTAMRGHAVAAASVLATASAGASGQRA